eukprot:sb/3478725/
MPAQVSESEIEVVASTVSEQWPTLAKILGISESEYSKFTHTNLSGVATPSGRTVNLRIKWGPTVVFLGYLILGSYFNCIPSEVLLWKIVPRDSVVLCE